MAKAQVYVTYRQGVLEPQGLAVQGVLASLGFEEVLAVRIGKYIEVELRDSAPENLQERLQAMCERVLANPVIEDFRFEVVDG